MSQASKDLKALVEKAGFEVIGQRVRRLRMRRNLTIRELAQRAEVSKNTLLSLEQGHPTHLTTIRVICRALRMKPEDLVGEEFVQPSVVALQRKEDLVWYDMNTFSTEQPNTPLVDPEAHAPHVTPFSRFESCSPDRRVTPHIIEIDHPTSPRSHRGEEFVYVIKGQVRIQVGTHTYDLVEGDSMCFWAAENHVYEPLIEGESAHILSIVLDPFPKLVK